MSAARASASVRAFVQTGDFFGHLWIGMGVGGLALLGHLVEGVHVGLLCGHVLLEGLGKIKSDKMTIIY